MLSTQLALVCHNLLMRHSSALMRRFFSHLCLLVHAPPNLNVFPLCAFPLWVFLVLVGSVA